MAEGLENAASLNRRWSARVVDDVYQVVEPCDGGAPADGRVAAMAFSGTALYIGGSLTHVQDICDQNLERRKAVEISLSSGQLTNWAPAFNSPFGLLVTAVDPISHTLWAGGDFTTVNKVAVAHLAAFPCTTC